MSLADDQKKLQLALSLHQKGNLNEAAKLYNELVATNSNNYAALHLLGVIEASVGRFEQAKILMARSMLIQPPNIKFIENYATALFKSGDFESALKVCEQGFQFSNANASLLYVSANSLLKLSKFRESTTQFDKLLLIQPNDAVVLNERGAALAELKQFEAALSSVEKALIINPRYAEAHLHKGLIFKKLNCFDEALAAYDKAIELKHDFAEAWLGRGDIFHKLFRFAEAAKSYARLLEIAPNYKFAKGNLLYAKMMCCDWENFNPLNESIEKDIQTGKQSTEPFIYQAIASSALAFKKCCEIYTADRHPRSKAALWHGERYNNDRIRIGYLSGEFKNHVVSYLMAELFELHDRNCFETFAFDNSIDDGSLIRQRIHKAFDNVIDISRLDDLQAAETIKQRQIDVLINLNGYFGDERTNVFSLRPAPIQVNYLGFTATMGADYIDYIIADRYVIPSDHKAFYTEKIVYLPNTYQVSDTKRPIADRTPSRTDLRLPDRGFVFCCFNNSFKITPNIFDVWMRVLNKVEGSVLWLTENNPTMSNNLRIEAARRGIRPERILFAPTAQYSEYLARYKAADLFLDTLPFNAGATASDALWAGLPVMTCSGQLFTARMAGSLLNAVGLPELITSTIEAYEKMAIDLATNSEKMTAIKRKLANNRLTAPLFDTKLFTKHIEAAYTAMHKRQQANLPTDHIVISN